MRLPLLLGIKRKVFRDNDRERARADAELAAKRSGILMKHEYKCQACGYESRVETVGAKKKMSFLDIHHRDDNHQNNVDDNLAPACHTCHPYQHIGELSYRTDARISSEGLGARTLIACIPEVPASDLNLLQRALGVALKDPQEARIAKRIIEALAQRGDRVREEFETLKPKDFAACMHNLSPAQYDAREDAIADLRLLFNVDTLEALGDEMMQDYPTLPIKTWPSVAQGVARKSSGAPTPDEEQPAPA